MNVTSPFVRSLRSEVTRLDRRAFRIAWPGIAVLVSVIIVAFIFTASSGGQDLPAQGPGGQFPDLQALEAPDGYVAAIQGLASMLGVLTLSFWAIASASDFSTGLIRLLIQAEPRRMPLLSGKVAALIIWSAGIAVLAVFAVAVTSFVLAGPSDIDTAAWADGSFVDGLATVGRAWLDLFLATAIWGAIGMTIAILTRSSGIAIAAGVSYILIFESVIGLVAEDATDWLPGGILSALAAGGTATVDYRIAVVLGLGYAALGLAASLVIFTRRDIID